MAVLRPKRPLLSPSGRAMLPAVAIVVPASLLAVLGWRAYRAEALSLRARLRQDQTAIVRLAGARLSEEATKALNDLADRVQASRADSALELRFRASHKLAGRVFVLREGQLVYPNAPPAPRRDDARLARDEGINVPRYIRRVRRLRRQRALVRRALRAEYGGKLRRAAVLYARVARRSSRPAARALLGLSRVYRRRGDVARARTALLALTRRFGRLRDESGAAFGLLGDAGLVEIGDAARLLAMHERLARGRYGTSASSRRFYLHWVVRRLRAAAAKPVAAAAASTRSSARGRSSAAGAALPLVSRPALRAIERRTAELFAAARFGRELARYGVAERALAQLSNQRVGAMSLDANTVLLLRRDGGRVVGFALDRGELVRKVALQQRRLLPSGRGITLRLRRVGQRASASGSRLIYSAALAAPLGHFYLAAWRSAADPLEALERREQLRHIAMVLGLVLVLAAGLFFTYRGVRRESDLAQLKSDFASNVSHELKTPLTSIRMYAEMLQQGIASSDDDKSRYHEVIIRESERLGRLIANVLDFSRVERGTRRYDLGPVDLAALAREALETFARLADDDGADIALERPPAAAPAVTADREAAMQSLLNLLSNAVKYSGDKPHVRLRVVGAARAAAQGELGVEVSDRGMGIPAAELKHIFDDFYRAPQARQAGVEGTGLGLALVRRHMEALGGRVGAESVLGEGSRFTLWFPVANTEGEAGEPQPADETTKG